LQWYNYTGSDFLYLLNVVIEQKLLDFSNNDNKNNFNYDYHIIIINGIYFIVYTISINNKKNYFLKIILLNIFIFKYSLGESYMINWFSTQIVIVWF